MRYLPEQAISQALNGYPDQLQPCFYELHNLIQSVANEVANSSAIESIKWGQPS
jgi:hypothetical protein